MSEQSSTGESKQQQAFQICQNQSSTGESKQQQAFQICQNRAAQVKVSSSRHSKYVRTEQHR